MNTLSKTFCILPWIHFYANPDGNVLPCCIGNHNLPLGNVQKNYVIEIWNSDRYKSMRLNMLNGSRCEECSSCYQQEDSGVNSFRQSVNNDYSEFLDFANETNTDGSLDEIKLKYLDIRWSNICNFKCRSCSSTYSSSWATEDNKNGQSKEIFIFAGGKNNDSLYEQLMPYISEVKEIYFAGGEPLLMDKHYQILEHLISTGNTNIKIRYNSNLSSLNFKDKNVIDMWKHFSNIHLNVSLDSWDVRAEYIREGTNWVKITENIKLIQKECAHISIGIASVISVFNVYTIPEFLDYLIDHNLIDNNTSASFYCLINPSFYSFDILDDAIKDRIIKKLSETYYNTSLTSQINNVIACIKNSNYNSNLRIKFLKHTEYYDTLRNRSFADTFPELKEITSF